MTDRQRQLLYEIFADRYGFNDLMEKYGDDPDWQYVLRFFANRYPDDFNEMYSQYIASKVQAGEMSGADAYGSIASVGGASNDQTSKFIDDVIARENTQQQQGYETEMRDTSLLSSANQLNSLGLSPSNVIQVGGASSGVSSQPAGLNMHSAVNDVNTRAINRYNQRMSMAKQLISTAGQMASSGIYGASLGAMKASASKVASATAHSGLQVLKSFSGQGNKSFADDSNFMAEWNKLPGQGI